MANIFDEETTVEIRRSKTSAASDGNVSSDEVEHLISDLHTFENFHLPFDITLYTNGLLKLADPILSVLLSIPKQSSPYDINYFRLQMLEMLREFKTKAVAFDYHPSVIEKSTYVLCAALDEEIAHTKWGKEGGWVNHSLLSSMFTQRNGGEIFFVLLDKACQQPKLLIDFIELVYILIMLGFKGKYSETDKNELYEIKSYVFSLIEHYHKRDDKQALPKNEENKKNFRPFIGIRFRYIALNLIVLCLILFAINQIMFVNSHESIHSEIQKTVDYSKSKVSGTNASYDEKVLSYEVGKRNASDNQAKTSDSKKSDKDNHYEKNNKNRKHSKGGDEK